MNVFTHCSAASKPAVWFYLIADSFSQEFNAICHNTVSTIKPACQLWYLNLGDFCSTLRNGISFASRHKWARLENFFWMRSLEHSAFAGTRLHSNSYEEQECYITEHTFRCHWGVMKTHICMYMLFEEIQQTMWTINKRYPQKDDFRIANILKGCGTKEGSMWELCTRCRKCCLACGIKGIRLPTKTHFNTEKELRS